jgi:hypothetical protein
VAVRLVNSRVWYHIRPGKIRPWLASRTNREASLTVIVGVHLLRRVLRLPHAFRRNPSRYEPGSAFEPRLTCAIVVAGLFGEMRTRGGWTLTMIVLRHLMRIGFSEASVIGNARIA